MTEYNRISDGNFPPTSNNGKDGKLFANLLPCDNNVSNDCEDQAYNSLPPMSSPCYERQPQNIASHKNSSSFDGDGQYDELRSSAENGGTMSPRVPPMAFTIDFGNDDTSEANSTPKRLGLRDGIGRFAPSKKFRERPNSPRHVPSSKNVQRMPLPATVNTKPAPADNDLLSFQNSDINQQLMGAAAAAHNNDKYIPTIDNNKKGNSNEFRSDLVEMSLQDESKKEFSKGYVTHQASSSLHTTTFVTTTKERISPVDVVIDEENNIASNDATLNTTNNTLERSGSEAGTYTIDNDDEENGLEENVNQSDNRNNSHQKELNGQASYIKETGGVLGGGIKDEKINTHEWVNMWATNNSLIMNKDNKEIYDTSVDNNYDDDFEEEEEEESSLSSIRGGDGDGSRSRRKLPTVPSPTNRVGINNNSIKSMPTNVPSEPAKHDQTNTDDYLKDTISLMAAMEARLSNGDDDGQRKHHHPQRGSPYPNHTPHQDYTSRSTHQHSRPASGSAISTKPSNKMPLTSQGNARGNVPAGSAASIEQAKKAKELAAWKARKNYDPLRSANISKKSAPQNHLSTASPKRPTPAQQQALITNNEGDIDSYSEDTCSDLDAASSVSQQTYQRQHQASITPASNRFQPSLHARTNRAFALRQTNSLQINENIVPSPSSGAPGMTINGSPKRTPSEESFSRSDGGRWSLRNKKNSVTKAPTLNSNSNKSAAMTSSIHRVQPSAKKKSVGMRNVMNGGRSTSSLSSREVEFQAWKRRKNYDPLRSAKSANARNTPHSASPLASTVTSSAHQTKVASPPQPIRRSTFTKTNKMPQQHHKSSSTQPRDASGDYSNLLRSASFHYPDGLSRLQLNVYTSEDDDDSQVGVNGDFPAGLYEVNEDELILTIGGGGNDNESLVSMRPSGNQTPLETSRTSPSSMSHWPPSNHNMQPAHKMTRSSPSRGSSNKLEALDNLVISTIFSVSSKLCLTSSTLMRQLQEQTTDKEQLDYLDTLLYVLEDVDPPMSPSKKTSRELAGTLRNLKKVEQALQTLLTSDNSLSLTEDPSEEVENEN